MSDRIRIKVRARMEVNVGFAMEVKPENTLEETKKQARDAAERVAVSVIGNQNKGDEASASLQRITSFEVQVTE